LGINAFADALETLPVIMAENGGWDAVALLAKCRAIHQLNDGLWHGIDMDKGEPADMVNTLHVVEPAEVLESVLQTATETVTMLLRIDGVHAKKPQPTFALSD